MKKRKPFIMIATGVMVLNLYGCGKTEEDLKKECDEKGEFFTYNEEISECVPIISNPIPLPSLKEECDSKGEDFSYIESTGECVEVMTNPLPP